MIILWKFSILISAFLLVQANCTYAVDEECVALNTLNGINSKLFALTDEVYPTNGLFFCSQVAPDQYQCDCPTFYACKDKPDPWGNSIGMCGCCAWYVPVIIITLVLLFLATPFILGSICCKSKWYLFGYPPPLPIIVPRRGAVTRVLTGPSIPPHLFTEFNIQHFADEEPHRVKREEL